MKYALALAAAGLAGLSQAQVVEEFVPGLDVPSSCHETPELNICPAIMPSGNAFLTSYSRPIMSAGEPHIPGGQTLFRVQLLEREGELVEERTLSIFDMPSGHGGKQCRLHFIYNQGNAYPNKEFTVWQLEGDGSDVTDETNWDTKPERTTEIGTFAVGDKMEPDLPNGVKFDATFEGGNPVFPCPGPGIFAYETSGHDTEPRGMTDLMLNLAGGDGLGLEIIGSDSEYDMFAPTTTTTILSVPTPSGTTVLPIHPPSGTPTGVPGTPDFDGAAGRVSVVFGGLLMAAALPLLF